jgi:hypothetical protein
MIYERELHFQQSEFEDEKLFPSILIVRQKKNNASTGTNSTQEQINSFKVFMKTHINKCQDIINTKNKE